MESLLLTRMINTTEYWPHFSVSHSIDWLQGRHLGTTSEKDYFQFLCSFVSNGNFFSTRGSRCCDTTKWKWICTGVPNRICTGVFRMEKQKCQKQKECLKYKTNKQTQRESMTICVLNNSDLVEFLVLHVGFSFAMQQFINGVSTLKCYSFEIRK